MEVLSVRGGEEGKQLWYFPQRQNKIDIVHANVNENITVHIFSRFVLGLSYWPSTLRGLVVWFTVQEKDSER